MKRDELKALGLTDESIDKVMALHGQGIEELKTQNTELQARATTAEGQLADATKQIEAFKGMKIEEIQAAATDWEQKYNKSVEEAAATKAALELDHAFEMALVGARAKSVRAAAALFDRSKLKLEGEKLTGFDEQLAEVQKENAYLFTAEQSQQGPSSRKLVAVRGSNSRPVAEGDAQMDAILKGAGLKPEDVRIK